MTNLATGPQHSDAVDWVNGNDVYATWSSAFRENLGATDRVPELLAKYWQRNLLLDPRTGARIDHLRIEPGYEDLSSAYHDSVEECYLLGGGFNIPGEGEFLAGDYFWRPPGFVHKAYSPNGFEALLMMQGYDPDEGSDHVSRAIRPDDQAGTNARTSPLESAIGPRGWVRQLRTSLVAWTAADNVIGPSVPGALRILSRNVITGACSALVRLPAMDTATALNVASMTAVVLEGDLTVDGVLRNSDPPELSRVSAPVEVTSKSGCFAFAKLTFAGAPALAGA